MVGWDNRVGLVDHPVAWVKIVDEATLLKQTAVSSRIAYRQGRKAKRTPLKDLC